MQQTSGLLVPNIGEAGWVGVDLLCFNSQGPAVLEPNSVRILDQSMALPPGRSLAGFLAVYAYRLAWSPSPVPITHDMPFWASSAIHETAK